jgi:hypothetical protein
MRKKGFPRLNQNVTNIPYNYEKLFGFYEKYWDFIILFCFGFQFCFMPEKSFQFRLW